MDIGICLATSGCCCALLDFEFESMSRVDAFWMYGRKGRGFVAYTHIHLVDMLTVGFEVAKRGGISHRWVGDIR